MPVSADTANLILTGLGVLAAFVTLLFVIRYGKHQSKIDRKLETRLDQLHNREIVSAEVEIEQTGPDRNYFDRIVIRVRNTGEIPFGTRSLKLVPHHRDYPDHMIASLICEPVGRKIDLRGREITPGEPVEIGMNMSQLDNLLAGMRRLKINVLEVRAELEDMRGTLHISNSLVIDRKQWSGPGRLSLP